MIVLPILNNRLYVILDINYINFLIKKERVLNRARARVKVSTLLWLNWPLISRIYWIYL